MSSTKVLGMTDVSNKTGFGVVMDHILSGMAKTYDTYLLGWGFHYEEPIKKNGYTVLPSGNHPFGGDVLPYILQQLKPEVLITQADTRMIDWLPNVLNQVPNKPTWIFYPVVDGFVWNLNTKMDKWPSNWSNIINQSDHVVAMTDFGKRILESSGVEKSKVSRIYHGVDTQMFRPYLPEEKEQIKASLGLQGKYVIGGVFKSITRKNPEKYLHAFQIFRQGREDKVALLLHTPPNPQSGGEFDLVQQATDIGLTVGKDVFFSNTNVPAQIMPQIYNAMDTFWALGGMESFCVPVIEAMSCGTPIVALNGNVYPELTADSALLVDIPKYPGGKDCLITQGSYNGVEGLNVNPYEVAKRTEQLYLDKQLREKCSYKGVEEAITRFDWSIIQPQWLELIKKVNVSVSDLPLEWQNALK
jgi:glycosyltransferase involved in cell wall biosynthesis